MTTNSTPGVPVKGGRPSRRPAPLHRASNRFLGNPSSARNAVILIIAADVAAVFLGALVIWLVDRGEFEQFGTAFWYILQTVTTVGYGDVTPTEQVGRLIGGIVMLLAIASLSILTASITSSFIDARQAVRRVDEDSAEDARWSHLEGRLDEVIRRLDARDLSTSPTAGAPMDPATGPGLERTV